LYRLDGEVLFCTLEYRSLFFLYFIHTFFQKV